MFFLDFILHTYTRPRSRIYFYLLRKYKIPNYIYTLFIIFLLSNLVYINFYYNFKYYNTRIYIQKVL